MECLENGNFNVMKFIGKPIVYNGYLNQAQSWEEYPTWAKANIY